MAGSSCRLNSRRGSVSTGVHMRTAALLERASRGIETPRGRDAELGHSEHETGCIRRTGVTSSARPALRG
eukprot:scaffold97758_cov66-Phaeocystis_antarctica.AAC.2